MRGAPVAPWERAALVTERPVGARWAPSWLRSAAGRLLTKNFTGYVTWRAPIRCHEPKSITSMLQRRGRGEWLRFPAFSRRGKHITGACVVYRPVTRDRGDATTPALSTMVRDAEQKTSMSRYPPSAHSYTNASPKHVCHVFQRSPIIRRCTQDQLIGSRRLQRRHARGAGGSPATAQSPQSASR